MNRWYFWVLAPVMIAGAIIIPLVAEPKSISGHVVAWALAGTLLLATLGLADSTRFRWALRSVAALMLLAGVAYFVLELAQWRSGKPLNAFGRRSDSSLWNAGLFLLIFGVPALRFLLSGRSERSAIPGRDPDRSQSHAHLFQPPECGAAVNVSSRM